MATRAVLDLDIKMKQAQSRSVSLQRRRRKNTENQHLGSRTVDLREKLDVDNIKKR